MESYRCQHTNIFVMRASVVLKDARKCQKPRSSPVRSAAVPFAAS
jgi:hypothetical protein